MLGAKDNLNLGLIRHTGGEELPKGCLCQRAIHCGAQHIGIAEKRNSSVIHRTGVNVIGRTLLDDFAIAHQSDLIRHAHRFFRLMSDQQDGCVLFFQKVERFIPDPIAQAVVEA